MLRRELAELQYITPLSNLSSICRVGILSHNRASQLKPRPKSIANVEIQERRHKRVPQGRPLHDYVNLYFCARNPMMYLRRDRHESICVLRISHKVIDLPDVVITDRNAACDFALFSSAPNGLKDVDTERVFARYWTHPGDFVAEKEHKAVKCAEVLVPDRVEAKYITGVYCSCDTSAGLVREAGLKVSLLPDLFFQ